MRQQVRERRTGVDLLRQLPRPGRVRRRRRHHRDHFVIPKRLRRRVPHRPDPIQQREHRQYRVAVLRRRDCHVLRISLERIRGRFHR
jgi:hypothetical protein